MQLIHTIRNYFRTPIMHTSPIIPPPNPWLTFPRGHFRTSEGWIQIDGGVHCVRLAYPTFCSLELKAVRGPCSWAEAACLAAPESRAKPVKAFQSGPVFSGYAYVKVPRWFSWHSLCRDAVAASCHWRLRSSGRSSQRELAHVFWQVKLNKMK